ncbi:MAG: type II toxin-antitoxin system RelB/DinJ family antitoxin [bacterium]
MAKTATVRARMEPSLKRRGEAVLSRIGLSPTDAVTLFYTQVTLNQGLPFSTNIPNAETAKVIRDARKGRGLLKPKSFDAWEKELRAMRA